MRRAAVLSALRGEPAGFVAGISWLPPGTLGCGDGIGDGAESLAATVRELELDFAFVPAEEPWAADAVERVHDAGAVALWAVSGVLGRLGSRLGWTEALRLSAAQPEVLVGPLAEALHRALVSARAGSAAGADLVLVADDLAGAAGPLVSPDFALDALMPCYRSIAAAVFGQGTPAAFHSDGDVRTLMPSLARAGFSALHLAGITPESLGASIDAAHAAGLAALGGVVAVSLGDDPEVAGRRAGREARQRRLLVCDDGGLATAEDVAAYKRALKAARTAYSEEGSGS